MTCTSPCQQGRGRSLCNKGTDAVVATESPPSSGEPSLFTIYFLTGAKRGENPGVAVNCSKLLLILALRLLLSSDSPRRKS